MTKIIDFLKYKDYSFKDINGIPLFLHNDICFEEYMKKHAKFDRECVLYEQGASKFYYKLLPYWNSHKINSVDQEKRNE